MCELLERLVEKSVERDKENIKHDMKMNIAKNLLARGGMTLAEIADLTNLTLDEVKALAGGVAS